ncbi:MAG: branched-chain amino acid ABC transporter permease [Desulfobulbaceae bacterium A2]|nr:MAG: branched-chain amino acid ABC transporter permease [Desulfobulbaceae bacterium A2]
MLARQLPVLLLIGFAVAVQLACSAGGTTYYLTQLTMSAYYTLVVLGLCMLMGYAGQASLGHAGFFAIGGYLAAALSSRNLMGLKAHPLVELLDRAGLLVHGQDLFGAQLLVVQPWAACLAAVLAAALVAAAIGGPVLKLKGHYLAMATLGFGIIVYRLVLASSWLGEADGISDVPPFTLLPAVAGLGAIRVEGGSAARVANYYVAWGVLILGLVLLRNLVDSRMGRALRALHTSEEAAAAMGVNINRCKLAVFVLSAVYAAIAGVLLTHYNGGIGPSEAGAMKSVRYVSLVAVGGMANLWGALVMGVTLSFLSLRGVFGTYDAAVFGAILISIMLFAPAGLFHRDLRDRLLALLPGRRRG